MRGASEVEGKMALRGVLPFDDDGLSPGIYCFYQGERAGFPLEFGGYEPCRDAAAIVEKIGYDPERDVENSPDSVFCSHGAGFPVKWNEANAHMHLPVEKIQG